MIGYDNIVQQFVLELRQTQREERKIQKPWRKNMKSFESQETENEEKEAEASMSTENNVNMTTDCKKISLNGSKLDDNPSTLCQGTQLGVETEGVEVQEALAKPWRQNMQKYSVSKQKGN